MMTRPTAIVSCVFHVRWKDVKEEGKEGNGERWGGDENTLRVRLGTGSGKGNGRKCVPTT